LLAAWAEARRIDAVLLGHTADDQAETVLLRLARGSGVDGLAGMGDADWTGRFRRPLLGLRRADLRGWLRNRGIGWSEDPSNDDPRFDRVRARQAMALLAGLGLTADRLTEAAAHMARAQVSLRRQAAAFADAHVRAEAGDLILAPEALDLSRSDSEGRVLSAAIRWIGGGGYRPRYEALTEAAAALRRGGTRTLGGVLMVREAAGIRLTREAAAAEGPVPAPAGPSGQCRWDGRWHVRADRPPAGPCRIAALGERGLNLVPHWRDAGLPRASLLATPAIWHGETLVAAPLAGLAEGWTAELGPGFATFLLSH
jgi:tRNA(Ile)-lysidine synthase